MSRRVVLALLCVSLLATNAMAWGNAGHKITARLAQDKLSDSAEQEVRAILGQRWMADVASLPDEWRNNDGAKLTGGWHFVNTPIEAEAYDQARDCPGDQCVVEQLEDMRATLANRDASTSARREALIYIIHFVGDIHQPFHCGSGTINGQSDRGGNSINVTFDGQQRNLHSVWDSGLISKRGLSVAAYVEHLEEEVLPGLETASARLATGFGDSPGATGVTGGTPADWANESHQVAQDQRVENNTTLSSAYVSAALPIVDQRLARGALRLAKFIEETLGGN